MLTSDTPIESVPRIPARIRPALKRLGIKTVRDLLFHFPTRYEDFSNRKAIRDIVVGETVTVQGTIQRITSHRTIRKRMALAEAEVRDESGTLMAIWFNQPFLARTLKVGDRVSLAGKVTLGKRGPYLANPAYEKITSRTGTHTAGLVPVYPETKGITSRWLRFLIKSLLEIGLKTPDPLPPETRERHRLLALDAALRAIHFPRASKEARDARRRFDFEALLTIQLRALQERLRLRAYTASAIPLDLTLLKSFVRSLPFPLTNAQRRSLWEIVQDLSKPRPMNRLLEGDVGSGKTVVAAGAALAVARADFQTAFMAPTEILAQQHYETLSQVLTPFRVRVGLLTGSRKYISPQAAVVVGTHALIQKTVRFKNLGLVVVDEQHRFGVEQRAALLRDPNNPNTSELPETEPIEGGKIVERELSYKLNGVLFRVQDELGRFGREKQYGDILAKKLESAGLVFQREFPIGLNGGSSNIVDFLVENKIVVELKAKPFIEKSDYYQMARYLESSHKELGLIVNFRQKYLKPKRILNPRIWREKSFGTFGMNSDSSDRFLPHFLSMSATPIPRTLALTVYGDLDLSVLDEMPRARKPVETRIVEPAAREETYAFIRREVARQKQVFVICPRIDATGEDGGQKNFPDRAGQQQLLRGEERAVKQEYEKLSKKVFPDLSVGMLHGKMKSNEKQAVMKKFKNREYDILVSTSVVEVGVDVPNATIMMIEGAERFGLATLHQFRGRVGRGKEQSYCFLFPTENGMAARRLRAVVEAKTGFELAEKDLAIRGPGDLFGIRQWGVPTAVLAAITDATLVREVRQEAAEILNADPTLTTHPLLRHQMEEQEQHTHLE